MLGKFLCDPVGELLKAGTGGIRRAEARQIHQPDRSLRGKARRHSIEGSAVGEEGVKEDQVSTMAHLHDIESGVTWSHLHGTVAPKTASGEKSNGVHGECRPAARETRRRWHLTITIHDLRDRPQHADAVAERIWRAFWRSKGKPLKAIRDGLENFLEPDTRIPFALVAERDGNACGNALVIDNDESSRPQLTPWLAALWVDEAMRKQGLAAALLSEAIKRSAALGVERLYLVARPALRDFYASRGWQPIEDNVGEARLTVHRYIIPGAPRSVPSIIRK